MEKRGRPRSEKAKNVILQVRMDAENYEKVVFIMERTGLNLSDILRKSIDLLYKISKFGG